MPEVTIVRESDTSTGMTTLGMTVRWPGGRIDHASIEIDGFDIAYNGGLGPKAYVKLFQDYLSLHHDDGK